MTTIGTLLYYGDKVDDFTGFAPNIDTLTQIKGVQNIPELQTAPGQIDVTSLEDYEEQSEPGLITGSALNIVMNYKENIYKDATEMGGGTAGDLSNFQQCLNIHDDKVRVFVIILKNGRWFAFNAKSVTTIGAVQPASVFPFTLSLYKRSGVYSGYVANSEAASKTPANYFAMRNAGIMDVANLEPTTEAVSTEEVKVNDVQVEEEPVEEVTTKI